MSLIPKYSTYNQQSVDLLQLQHIVQLKYQLLPPHPPFLTSISSKLKDAVLFNSGDMLFAILVDRNLFSSPLSDFPKNGKSSSVGQRQTLEHLCYCQQQNDKVQASERIANVFDDELQDTEAQQRQQEEEDNKSNYNKTKTVADDCVSDDTNEDSTVSKCILKTVTVLNDTSNKKNENNDNDVLKCNRTVTSLDCDIKDENLRDYVSYVQQGFVLRTDIDDSIEPSISQPDSPFNCTETEMPCTITTLDGQAQLKKSFEHRCFKLVDKGVFFLFFCFKHVFFLCLSVIEVMNFLLK